MAEYRALKRGVLPVILPGRPGERPRVGCRLVEPGEVFDLPAGQTPGKWMERYRAPSRAPAVKPSDPADSAPV